MTSRTSRGFVAMLDLLQKMGRGPMLLRLVAPAPTSRSICLTPVVFSGVLVTFWDALEGVPAPIAPPVERERSRSRDS